jgi:hypothetical protein
MGSLYLYIRHYGLYYRLRDLVYKKSTVTVDNIAFRGLIGRLEPVDVFVVVVLDVTFPPGKMFFCVELRVGKFLTVAVKSAALLSFDRDDTVLDVRWGLHFSHLTLCQ